MPTTRARVPSVAREATWYPLGSQAQQLPMPWLWGVQTVQASRLSWLLLRLHVLRAPSEQEAATNGPPPGIWLALKMWPACHRSGMEPA